MAYYAPFYRPTYYNPMQTDTINQYNQQMQQAMPQPMAQPVPQPQVNNGLVWVQGEAGAKSYPVAPNCTVMLMDSEGERFYLKSADASGMPLPLRIFDYKERTTTAQQAFGGVVTGESVNLDNFVTRKEFDVLKASIASQPAHKKTKNNLTEDAENG